MSEASALLKAMRHVAKTKQPAAGAEPSELHAKCRQYLLDDFKGFMTKLADLEKAHQAARVKEPKQKASEPPGRDAGKERVEVAIQRLLDEAKET